MNRSEFRQLAQDRISDATALLAASRWSGAYYLSLERISIEVSNRCRKGCSFCYNSSSHDGATRWTVAEIVTFARSCARGGVKALSLGGGEPLEFPGIFEILRELDGLLFRSLTTSGLPLDTRTYEQLRAARPDKVHVSIHFPEQPQEVSRVIKQVVRLNNIGIKSGINLLVRRSQLSAAILAAREIRAAGIDAKRIVYLPMRGRDTPSPAEIAQVADNQPFQSMSCLTACAKSSRFCSIGWDRSIAWCSYTKARTVLNDLTYSSLLHSLEELQLEYCGDELVSLG